MKLIKLICKPAFAECHILGLLPLILKEFNVYV